MKMVPPEIHMENRSNKHKKKIKVRKWFFTHFKESIDWQAIADDYGDIIRFIKVQLEVGEKTKRIHWQGVIHFINPASLTKVRKIIEMGSGKNAGDLQPQRCDGALKYVHKDEGHIPKSRFEWGKPSVQGFRSDLESIKKRLNKLDPLHEIEDDYFGQFCRYNSYFEKYRARVLEQRAKEFRHVKVILICGPTNKNKTKRCLYDKNSQRKPDTYKINCAGGLKWFPNYGGEKTILLDEFNNNVLLCKTLDILDGHECRVEYKGGHTFLIPKLVYITTNLRPEMIYPNASREHKDAFWRRINQTINLFPKTTAEQVTQSDYSNTGDYSHLEGSKNSTKHVQRKPIDFNVYNPSKISCFNLESLCKKKLIISLSRGEREEINT